VTWEDDTISGKRWCENVYSIPSGPKFTQTGEPRAALSPRQGMFKGMRQVEKGRLRWLLFPSHIFKQKPTKFLQKSCSFEDKYKT
jgi:hypothetical protein